MSCIWNNEQRKKECKFCAVQYCDERIEQDSCLTITTQEKYNNMENYEQKYKEALERMKSWARGEHPECFTEAKKAAEFVFPELAEDEDKKAKQWILEYLHDGLRKTDEQFKPQFESAISWLERQKPVKLDYEV